MNSALVPLISTDTALDRRWLAERLARQPGDPPGNELPLFVHPPERKPIPAAVLVPVINRAEGPTLMFTQRTSHLHDHAGQISFPGGRVEERDDTREATALREAEEETGLERNRVEIIGRLPDYDIMTGFRVTPVVGWVEPPFEARPDPFEVETIFEVPLQFFLDPTNHQAHSKDVNGYRRHYYAMPYEDYYIWGATAGMLRMLYHALVNSG
ncbi:MAG: CoA pyrophosphatase [Burkholderiales bacterium]|jgi:8-oxo-dGTP pyrophosphatase MutT (NUDIX family)